MVKEEYHAGRLENNYEQTMKSRAHGVSDELWNSVGE